MTQFFTNEQVSLEKEIKICEKIRETNIEDIKEFYEIKKCVEWVRENNFKTVCLQFPDHLLKDSVEVSFVLQNELNQPIYLLGDSNYESCCLDFISAAHVNADAIIHYGSICFSQISNQLPYLNIYEKEEINLEDFLIKFKRFLLENDGKSIKLLIDTPYIHKYDEIMKSLKDYSNLKICKLDNVPDMNENLYIYIGSSNRKLENLQFFINEKCLYQYNPTESNPEIVNFIFNSIIYKRRNYVVEKIKDGKIFGIIMGTLAVDNYLKILGRIKKLLKLNKKKYYIISVGRISVEKLANFPEIDIYVVITCAMNEVYDSKDFYKPIATPYDVEKAFNPEAVSLNFTYDYNSFLNKVTDEDNLKVSDEPDISLLTGNIRLNQNEEDENEHEESVTDIATKLDGTIVENSKLGAKFLNERSWKGLEQNLGQTKVELAEEGRSGLAQSYNNEDNLN